MRGQLEENNRRLWQMIEDERVLRLPMISLAACNHGDIRKCFWNLFRKICLIRENDGDVKGGMLQIERMNHFIDGMRKMTKTGRTGIKLFRGGYPAVDQPDKNAGRSHGRKIRKGLHGNGSGRVETLVADAEIIMEVADNLLSNAFRAMPVRKSG